MYEILFHSYSLIRLGHKSLLKRKDAIYFLVARTLRQFVSFSHAVYQNKNHDETKFPTLMKKIKLRPRGYKNLFLCSTQLSTKFQLLIKIKLLTNKEVSCFKSLRCCIYPANNC